MDDGLAPPWEPYVRWVQRRGAVPYELVCTECGEVTPGVTSEDRCINLDESLVCGHDPIRRDLLLYERAPVLLTEEED